MLPKKIILIICDNYEGIMLQSFLKKVLDRVMLHRLGADMGRKDNVLTNRNTANYINRSRHPMSSSGKRSTAGTEKHWNIQ